MINEEEVNSVSLRDVWGFLEVGTRFSDWARDRLEDFYEHTDFITILKKEYGNDTKGLPVYKQYKEYIVTIDTAKHIAMLERNQRGKELRQYFIDCEKRFNNRETSACSETKQDKALRIANAALDMAERWGFEGNQAKLSADRAVRKITGVSPLELMCSKELISETQERTYTPSELGQMLDDKISGIAVNKLLKAQGLQIQEVLKRNDGSTRKKWWELTEKGKDYAVLVDTGKKHSDGTPVQQIKWKKKIIKLLD